MLFLAIIIVLLTAFLITSLLRINSVIPSLLAIFLITVAQIVLVGEIAGLTGLMNNQLFYLIFHLLSLAISTGLWIKHHKPSIFPMAELKRELASLGSLPGLIRKYPDLFIFSAAILIATLVNALLILEVPPNTNDSMTTHMARIGFWLQNGSLEKWSTPNIYQLIFPINSQLQIHWTILLAGSDQFAGFIQAISAVFAGLAIYGIARLLKWDKSASLFALFCWTTFPQIILQSTSTQNDLGVAALTIIFFFFLFLGIIEGKKETLFLAGLALGLAIGTKQTIFFMAPGFLGILLMLIYRYRSTGLRIVRSWIIATLISTCFFGSIIYLKNLLDYRNPFGPSEIVLNEANSDSLVLTTIKLLYNPVRHFYQFIDPTGLPNSIGSKVVVIKARIFKPLFESIGLYLDSKKGLSIETNTFEYFAMPIIQEDTSWFGPLSIFVVLPAFFYQLAVGIRKRNVFILALLLSAFSFFIIVSVLKRGWTPYQGRYFVLSMTILAPLMASLFSNRVGGKLFRYLVALVGIVVIFYTTFKNPAKPFIRDYWTFNQGLSSEFQQRGLAGVMEQFSDIFSDPTSIFQLSRLEKLTLQGTLMRAPLILANNHMKAGDTLGLLGPDGTWHYPFFGDAFEFHLVPIYPEDRLFNDDWLIERGVDWVLVSYDSIPKSKIPGNLELVEELKNWGIYRPTGDLLLRGKSEDLTRYGLLPCKTKQANWADNSMVPAPAQISPPLETRPVADLQ